MQKNQNTESSQKESILESIGESEQLNKKIEEFKEQKHSRVQKARQNTQIISEELEKAEFDQSKTQPQKAVRDSKKIHLSDTERFLRKPSGASFTSEELKIGDVHQLNNPEETESKRPDFSCTSREIYASEIERYTSDSKNDQNQFDIPSFYEGHEAFDFNDNLYSDSKIPKFAPWNPELSGSETSDFNAEESFTKLSNHVSEKRYEQTTEQSENGESTLLKRVYLDENDQVIPDEMIDQAYPSDSDQSAFDREENSLDYVQPQYFSDSESWKSSQESVDDGEQSLNFDSHLVSEKNSVSKPKKTHAVFKTFLLLVLMAACGYGAYQAVIYFSPGQMAYRDLYNQIQTYSGGLSSMDASQKEQIIGLEDAFSKLTPEQQNEINDLMIQTTGLPFMKAVSSIKLSNEEEDVRAQIDELNASLSDLESQLSEQNALLENYGSQYQAARDAAAQAQSDVDTYTSEIERAKADNENKNKTIETLNSEIAQLEQEIAELKGSSAPQQSDNLEDLQDSTLNSNFDDSDSEDRGPSHGFDHDGHQNQDQEENQSDNQSDNQSLGFFESFRLSMKEKQLESKRNSLETAQKTIEQNNQDIISYQEAIDQANAEIESQNNYANEQLALYQQAEASCNELNASKQEQMSQLEQLDAKLQEILSEQSAISQ